MREERRAIEALRGLDAVHDVVERRERLPVDEEGPESGAGRRAARNALKAGLNCAP
jgi:hypothetical protein